MWPGRGPTTPRTSVSPAQRGRPNMYTHWTGFANHGQPHISLKPVTIWSPRQNQIWKALGSLNHIRYGIGIRPQCTQHPDVPQGQEV